RQVLVGFMDNKATAGIDKGYDALHIDTQPSDMYFLKGANKLVILGESYFNSAAILPVGVKNNIAGNVSFVIDGLENFDSAQPIYIFDNDTQLYHNIRNENFEVYLPAGTFHDRFSLRFAGPALATDDSAFENGIAIAYAQNQYAINVKNINADATVTKISLFNMLGQSVMKWNVSDRDQKNMILPVNQLSNGTYIVRLDTTKGTFSKKIAL